MDNQLTVFNHKEFGNVRIIKVDEKEWFVANDIAVALGYVKYRDAISKHCKKAISFKELSQGVSVLGTLSLQGKTRLIPEGDVYRLIIRSRLLTAQKFEEWVMDEVLPSIRKTGKFEVTTNKANSVLPTNFLEALKALVISEEEKLKLKEANQKQGMLLKEQKPKVDFFDTVSSTKKLYSIREAAKSLGFKNMGQNNLFEFLRVQKVLLNAYEPYQNQVNLGRFKVKIGQVTKGDKTRMTKKVMVTIKGMEYIRKLLIKNGYKRVSNFTISNV